MQAQFPYALPQVTIPNGTAISNAVMIGSGVLVGIIMPAAWTTGAITFQVSIDGTSFFELVDNTGNTELKIATPTASTFIAIANFDDFRGVIYLKIQSGVTGTTVNQGAARVLTLVVDKSLMGAF